MHNDDIGIIITKQFYSDCLITIVCLSRPQSWGPQCKSVEQERRVEYHCYSQLLSYIQDPSTSPYPAPISSTATAASTASQGDGVCPQSSLAQCTCEDLELELSGEPTLSHDVQ